MSYEKHSEGPVIFYFVYYAEGSLHNRAVALRLFIIIFRQIPELCFHSSIVNAHQCVWAIAQKHYFYVTSKAKSVKNSENV